MNQVHTTKSTAHINVNTKALFAEITPDGISLIAVLGLRASNLRSRYRLNAIAADRAKTMQRITKPSLRAIRDRGI